MGDLLIKIFEAKNVEPKGSHYVTVRLVGDYGKPRATAHVKDNTNPAWNVAFRFKVRKQDLKVRYEILKSKTFGEKSVGVVEVAVGGLLPSQPSDMWVQFLNSAVALHTEITFIPDYQLQRDIAVQKALERDTSNVGHVIMTGGSGIIGQVNRSVDGTLRTQSSQRVVYVQQQPQQAPPPGQYVVQTTQQQQQPGMVVQQQVQGQPMYVQQTGQPGMVVQQQQQVQGQPMYVQQTGQPQPQQQQQYVMQHSASQQQLQYVQQPGQQQPMMMNNNAAPPPSYQQSMQGQPVQQPGQQPSLYPNPQPYQMPVDLHSAQQGGVQQPQQSYGQFPQQPQQTPGQPQPSSPPLQQTPGQPTQYQ